MAAKTYAVHTQEDNIRRIDQHAERLRRSRNSLFNEALEMLLDSLDGDVSEMIERNNKAKKKAGKQ